MIYCHLVQKTLTASHFLDKSKVFSMAGKMIFPLWFPSEACPALTRDVSERPRGLPRVGPGTGVSALPPGLQGYSPSFSTAVQAALTYLIPQLVSQEETSSPYCNFP